MIREDIRSGIAARDDGADARTYFDADAVLAKHGRSFYWARYLLTDRHASRATRLYRFCRHVDDLADEASSADAAGHALDTLRLAIAQHKTPSPLVADMLALMQECALPSSVVLELIDGVQSDLGTVRFADESSLLRYCYQVAGTVGIMMCHVLDVSDGAAFHHAIDLGIAMQLTNICRDVAEDAALGRRYLPASLIGDCAPTALQDPASSFQPIVCEALDLLLKKADCYYRSGERGLLYLPSGARSGVLVAARLYREIGVQLQRRHYDYWTGRVTVSPTAKLRLTLRALLMQWRTRVAFTAGRDVRNDGRHRHDPTLHIPLAGLPLTAFSSKVDRD